MPLNINYFFTLIFISLTISHAYANTADIDRLADDSWLHIQSPNFDIVTDLNEEKGRYLIEDLEAYRHFSTKIMGLRIVDNIKPLKMLAISSGYNFRKLGFDENIAGVFGLGLSGYAAIANVSGYTANSNASTFGRQVLFHEYNHFLLRFTQETKIAPKWYDEGYAEYWGTFKYNDEKISIGSAASIAFRAGGMLNQAGDVIVNTEKLFKATQYPEGKLEIGRFYAQSFFVVHYFNSDPKLRAQLKNYIEYLNGGYSEDQAFNKAFSISYSDLDKLVKKYVRTDLKMLVLSATEGAFKFPKPDITLSTIDTPTFYRLTSQVLSLVDHVEKDTLKSLLEKTIVLNPQFAPAKSLMLMHNYTDNAKKIIAELEQQAPNDPLFLTYKASNLLQQAQLLHAAGADNWQDTTKQARSLFRRAIKTDSSLGTAYYGLGDLYTYLPSSEPLQEGAVGLDNASLFDREENTFNKLTTLYIRQANTDGALITARNAIAFSKDKKTSMLSLLLDNLELFNTLSSVKSEKSEAGLAYKDGTLYVGAVANGKPEGIGKITRPNNSTYEGNFSNGAMHGNGKLVTYNGFIYEGNFQQGAAKGKAKITYPETLDIKLYDGDNEYTYPHGKGTSITKNGQYSGDFWYSQPHGLGSFITSDTKNKLSGRWIDGRYEWPELEGIQFIGGINAAGQRDSKGVCKTLASKNIEWCTFKDGVRQTENKEVKK